MIDILFKGIYEPQDSSYASGTIGGYWTFAHGGMKEVIYRVLCLHKWVASFDGWWRTTFPGGLNRDGEDAIKVMGMVNERLNEVYPEG